MQVSKEWHCIGQTKTRYNSKSKLIERCWCRPQVRKSFVTVDDIETAAGYPIQFANKLHCRTLLIFTFRSDCELCQAVAAAPRVERRRRRRQVQFSDDHLLLTRGEVLDGGVLRDGVLGVLDSEVLGGEVPVERRRRRRQVQFSDDHLLLTRGEVLGGGALDGGALDRGVLGGEVLDGGVLVERRRRRRQVQFSDDHLLLTRGVVADVVDYQT